MENLFTIILSSTVVPAIITTFLTLFSNKRKDTIENIIKERKIWRDELRLISLDIAKSSNLKELKIAISKLKVRINPYGLARDFVFYDSYIWEQISKLEKSQQIVKGELEKVKNTYINLISCLLKFDWGKIKK